jgi:hypothetical protein
MSSRTCSQSSEFWYLQPDLWAIGPAARPLSSGTCNYTSELGDSFLDLRARGLIPRPLGSGTHSQTSKIRDSFPNLWARGLVVRPSSSGTCYTTSCRRIRLARLHVLCLHTVDGLLIFLDLATGLIFCLPACSGTTSYMMHLTVHNDQWFLGILF